MPKPARIYWALVCLAGLGALVATLFVPNPGHNQHPIELALFSILALVAGSRKVSLGKSNSEDERGSMSLGFAITFAALLHLGPQSAVVVGVLGTISGCLFPQRQPYHQFFFNVSLSAVETLVGSLVFFALNGWSLSQNPLTTFIAVAVSCTCFFAVNTFGVANIISCYSGDKVWNIWKSTFLFTAPSYFASACAGSLAILVLHNNAIIIVAFLAPVIYLAHQSYVTHVARAEESKLHIEALQQKQVELTELYLATIKSMALAIDAKDQYTHKHILRVQRYANAIAKQLDLEPDLLQAVNTGALLHDIGKLGVPEYVLLKPGRLSPEEFDKIKLHPEIGAAILEPVNFPWPVLPIVRHHHEKWDGSGYPDGLAGEDIPLTARIMAVADVYDALTSTRSYRQAWSHEKTVEMIKKDAGTHFDPVVVDAFLEVIDAVVAEMDEELAASAEDASGHGTLEEASFAVENISRNSADLWVLYEFAQSLPNLGLEDTTDLIVKKLQEIYPGSTCVFLFANEEKTALTAQKATGLNQEFFEGARSLPGGVSLRALLQKEPYLGAYDMDDLILSSGVQMKWTAMNTSLVVPVYFGAEAIGTLNVYHADAQAFSDYDRQLLEVIGERAAPALQSAREYDRSHSDLAFDSLTGLQTLTSLASRFEDLVTDGKACSLLYLDINDLEAINDALGHKQGDTVLVATSGILRKLADPNLVARHGGDSFVVLLPGCRRIEAERITKQICDEIYEADLDLYHTKIGRVQIATSTGISTAGEDGNDFVSLLSSAEVRMTRAQTEERLSLIRRASDDRKAA